MLDRELKAEPKSIKDFSGRLQASLRIIAKTAAGRRGQSSVYSRRTTCAQLTSADTTRVPACNTLSNLKIALNINVKLTFRGCRLCAAVVGSSAAFVRHITSGRQSLGLLFRASLCRPGRGHDSADLREELLSPGRRPGGWQPPREARLELVQTALRALPGLQQLHGAGLHHRSGPSQGGNPRSAARGDVCSCTGACRKGKEACRNVMHVASALVYPVQGQP